MAYEDIESFNELATIAKKALEGLIDSLESLKSIALCAALLFI